MEFVSNDKIKSILHHVSESLIIPNFNQLKSNQIKFKNNKDIVTSIDIEVEHILEDSLTRLIDKSKFIGEEKFTNNPEILDFYNHNNYCWTVDPIDGTMNYVKGKENFAVMIALSFSNQILQSWIYKPITNEFMSAKLKEGTFLNNKKIIIKDVNSFSECEGSISTKYWNEKLQPKIQMLKKYFKKINSYGSIGCEYFDIVLGKRDFTLLSKLMPWDHIPGILLVREAQGFDSHFDFMPYKFNQKCENLVVSSSKDINIKIINKLMEM